MLPRSAALPAEPVANSRTQSTGGARAALQEETPQAPPTTAENQLKAPEVPALDVAALQARVSAAPAPTVPTAPRAVTWGHPAVSWGH